MTPSEVDLATLTPDEAHVARAAVAAHRKTARKLAAQVAFFEAVLARYHERPNAFVVCPGSDVPWLVFKGVADISRVEEPMPDDLADLYRAWKSA